MTKEEIRERNINRKEYFKAYHKAHRQKLLEYQKAWYESHKEARKASVKARVKAWKAAHKEQYKVYQKAYQKAYQKSDVNSLGQTKQSIRQKSQRILKQMNLHIPGYEIHHCFGYEDPSKFIYISKSLHLKIHKYLREHNIDASCDHWMHIRDIVNSTDEFMYIKC